MQVPIIVDVALQYFWKHCYDPKEECQASDQEEWESMIEDYDRWNYERWSREQ